MSKQFDIGNITEILVPTDFSANVERAYDYSIKIAATTGAKLHYLHVIEEPFDFAVRVEEILKQQKKSAKEKLKTLVDRARNEGVTADLTILRGRPFSSILSSAEKWKVDLVVMGTKGESSLKRILFGDMTSKVLLDVEIPVLTVPVNSKKPYLDRFLFTSDYRGRDLVSLKQTIGFASLFDAEVHILHVDTEQEMESESKFRGFKDYIENQVDYENLHFKQVQAEWFSQGVSVFVDEFPMSVIVINRYKKLFLKTLLWANSTQELSYYTHIPLLVMPAENLKPEPKQAAK